MCLCVSVCPWVVGVYRGLQIEGPCWRQAPVLMIQPLCSSPLCPSNYPSASLPLTVLPTHSLVLASGPLLLFLPLPGIPFP